MGYSLFLDDERYPPANTNMVIVRTVTAAKDYIVANPHVQFISFDNDLGEDEPEGYTLAKWLVDHDMDHNVLSPDFTFYAHTQNPIARENINHLLNKYLGMKYQKQDGSAVVKKAEVLN